MDLHIPGYKVLELIGKGGMAEVYRARHLRLDRDVALKVLLQRYADDSSFSERFIREARIAANLIHPNIVQIYDVNRHNGEYFLAMEYVPGGDLTQRINQGLARDEILAVIKELAGTLDYAHNRGYIHRDVKPGNVLFRGNNTVALSDFGIARAIHSDTNMTQAGMVVGTPSYMSPEQAQGKPLDGSADLYSLGVLSYQLLTGQLPFQADSSISVAVKHVTEPVPKLTDNLAVMQPFFDQALAKTPAERFTDGQEMADALSYYLAKVEPDGTEIAAGATNLDTQVDSDSATEVHGASELGHQLAIPAPFERSRATDRTHAGDLMHSHSNIQLVFMQINRFKVYITEPQKRSLLLGTLIGLLALTGTLLFIKPAALFSNAGATLSPGQQVRIGQLLTSADANLSANQLVAPSGNNAYEKYLAILAISPGDAIAIEGIASISRELENRFDQALLQSRLDDANSHLTKLKEINPDKDYQVLAQRWSEAEADINQNISQQLTQAAQMLQVGNTPEAISYYETVVEIAPSNTEAMVGLTNIANGKMQEAAELLAANEFSQARTALDFATSAASKLPDSSLAVNLDQLNDQIAQAQADSAFTDKLHNLLTLGARALNAGKIDYPARDSALFYFRQAQQLAPNNSQAKKGLSDSYDKMAAVANGYITAENSTAAKEMIARLDAVNQTHTELPSLRSKLKDLDRTLARRAANIEKINTLYQRADTYLAANRPRSADKIHAQIVRLDAGHPGLLDLGRKIADGYVYLAQREIDARDWSDVDVWVQKGFAHVPGHKKLAEMQAYAAQQLANRER